VAPATTINNVYAIAAGLSPDAEAKAKQLAKLGDIKLGRPTYINEGGISVPVPRDFYYREAGAPVPAPAPTTPISPGETEIQMTIQVVYSIK